MPNYKKTELSVTKYIYHENVQSDKNTPRQLAIQSFYKSLETLFRHKATNIQHKPTAYVSENIQYKIARFVNHIKFHYNIIGVEVPITMDIGDNKEWRDVVNLIIQDKKTGQLYIVDYKTSYDFYFSPYNGYPESKPRGLNYWNFYRTYMKMCMYRFMINNIEKKIIKSAAIIPFYLRIEKNGIIEDMDYPKIEGLNCTQILSKSETLHILHFNGILYNKVIEKFNLKIKHVDTYIENIIYKLAKMANSFAQKIEKNKRIQKYKRIPPKNLLGPSYHVFISGINESTNLLGINIYNILKWISSMITTTINILITNPENPILIYEIEQVNKDIKKYIKHLKLKEKDIIIYGKEVAEEIDPEGYKNNILKALIGLEEKNKSLSDTLALYQDQYVNFFWYKSLSKYITQKSILPYYKSISWTELANKNTNWISKFFHIDDIKKKTTELIAKDKDLIDHNLKALINNLLENKTIRKLKTVQYRDFLKKVKNKKGVPIVAPKVNVLNILTKNIMYSIINANHEYHKSLNSHLTPFINSWKRIDQNKHFNQLTTINTKGQKCLIQEYDKKKMFEHRAEFIKQQVEKIKGINTDFSEYCIACNKTLQQWTNINSAVGPIDLIRLKKELVDIVNKAKNLEDYEKLQLIGKINNIEYKYRHDMGNGKWLYYDNFLNTTNYTDDILLKHIETTTKHARVFNVKFKDTKYTKLMNLDKNSPLHIFYDKFLEGYNISKEYLPEDSQLENEDHGLRLPSIHKYKKLKGYPVPFFSDEFDQYNDNNLIEKFSIYNYSNSNTLPWIYEDEKSMNECFEEQVHTQDIEPNLFVIGSGLFDDIEKYKHLDPVIKCALICIDSISKLSRDDKEIEIQIKMIKKIINNIVNYTQMYMLEKVYSRITNFVLCLIFKFIF